MVESRWKMFFKRFYLSTRKHFFTLRVSEYQHKFPTEVVESSFLEILKSRADMVLRNWLYVSLREQVLDQRIPIRAPFQSQPCDSVIG